MHAFRAAAVKGSLSVALIAAGTILFAPLPLACAAGFETAVLPLLKSKCAACHGASTPQAGLNLESLETVLSGGKSGPAVFPGSPETSLLLQKVVSGAMPPVGEKLTDAEIQLVRGWIHQGARGEHDAGPLVTDKDVLPILQMRCITCHGKSRREADLDLRTIASRLKGGRSGPALAPGNPQASLMLQRVVSGEMPPPKMQFENNVKAPTDAEVEVLRQWIAGGAKAAPDELGAASGGEHSVVTDEDRQFWSFQPPVRPAVPEVKQAALVRQPIDTFLLRKLEEKQLAFSAEAEPLDLLRRAYIDLIGMPPTSEEIEAYLRDKRADTYERMIDRLLESPHYGERWAQHWLDLAGYADSEGIIDADLVRPHSWRYRDALIRALNQDQPYDRFLTEQIAGDELVDHADLREVTQETVDTLAATGFLRMTPDGTYSPANGSVAERMDVIADEIQVLSSAVMGLTVGCARCHDHKYDPIPQRDYYRLSAILQTALDPYDWAPPTKRLLDVGVKEELREAKEWNEPIEAEIKRLERLIEGKAAPTRRELLKERLAELPESLADDLRQLEDTPAEGRTDVQKYLAKKFADTLDVPLENIAKRSPEFEAFRNETRKTIDEAKQKLKTEPRIRALYDMGGEPSAVYLLGRGEAQSLIERVTPAVPSVLRVGLEPFRVERPWKHDGTSGNRLALARWLTQPNHPLTARVMVNRIWAHHFGRGLVATPSNFGRTGLAPSHPELLDWLATEFVRQGWSIKAMHRMMLTSAAYRQTSAVSDEATAADPENILLSRMSLRRMDSEALYDSILRVTGRLNDKPFGSPDNVAIKETGEIVAEGTKAGWRRAVYILRRRKTPPTILDVFDLPQLNPNCTERAESTVAPQALQMLNGETTRGHARYLAGRLIDEFPDDRARQIEQLYLRALTRRATENEIAAGLSSLDDLTAEWRGHIEDRNDTAPRELAARWSALSSLAHAVLSSAEFLYVD
ncbi:MAG: DUF1553 domain-containing protein [Acidobacteria bacterium]|nr:DUF1553 domain-containing protein [Acidobacteriota bacterium]